MKHFESKANDSGGLTTGILASQSHYHSQIDCKLSLVLITRCRRRRVCSRQVHDDEVVQRQPTGVRSLWRNG